MKAFKLFISITMISSFLLFCNSCAPEANIALNFANNQSNTYQQSIYARKDYLFDRPTAGSKKVKMNESKIDVTFDQIVTSVDENGTATADITIKAVKFMAKDQEGVSLDYDSVKSQDNKNALGKLIGQTYTIKISSTGKVTKIVNVAKARNAVKRGNFNAQAKSLVSDKVIKERHNVLALPDPEKSMLKKGDQWSRVVLSPPGMLIPKRYEKVYTVTNIDSGKDIAIAAVNMKAMPTSKTSAEAATTEFSPMAMMGGFDSVDKYEGKFVTNLKTGKIIDYYENIKVEYVAIQQPPDQDPDKGPDTLKLGFTKNISLKAVN